jgi:homoserine dehydrogenase
MLQGDAIREITLEGPGAGGIETASAVVADMVSVIGTTGTGFLQNDACWRELERLDAGKLRSPFYVRIEVEDRAGVLAHVALRLATHGVSIGRLVQHQDNGSATLHIVTHEAPAGDVDAALEEIGGLEESRAAPSALPVISDRGVPGLGWA